MAIAASLLVGLLALASSQGGLSRLPDELRTGVLVAAGLLVVMLVFLCTVRFDLVRLLGRRMAWFDALLRFGGAPGRRTTLAAMSAYATNYLLIGLGLWLAARAASLPQSLDFGVVTAAFALSWVLGFLAPGAPAGLGAREGVMLLLLDGIADSESLLAFVVLARAATMLGDCLCFALASLVADPEADTNKDRLP